jgi:glycosyltransferase involved in cell wall biosynthesis
MRVVQVLPSLDGGGAEIVAESLAIGLANRGHDSAVLSLYAISDASMTHEHLISSGVAVGSLTKRPGPSPPTVLALRSWLRTFGPDIVHTHVGGFLYGFPAAYRSGFPLVHTVHNDPRLEVPPTIRRMHSLAYRLGARGVVLSETFVESFRDVHSRRPIGVVPNGVDIARFTKTHSIVRNDRHESFRVLIVGRLEPQKRIDVFLEAMVNISRSLPFAVEARIVGDGPLRDELETLASEPVLDGRVDFTGRVDDIGQHLEWADAFVLSSDYEGMPLAIVEAMAFGLPVVATRVGAVPDLVLDGISGFLVDRQDPQALASRLEQLARDTGLSEAMGRAGRDRSEIFNVTAMVNGYESVYARVCVPYS